MYRVGQMEMSVRERQGDLARTLRRQVLLAEALGSRTSDADRSEHGDMIARALFPVRHARTALIGKIWRKTGWALHPAGQSGTTGTS